MPPGIGNTERRVLAEIYEATRLVDLLQEVGGGGARVDLEARRQPTSEQS